MRNLTWSDVSVQAGVIARRIERLCEGRVVHAYAVPRGGVYAALLVAAQMHHNSRQQTLCLVDVVEAADVIIDDIVDSGKTREHYLSLSEAPFLALVQKDPGVETEWVTFPWERINSELGAEENVRRLIEYIGDDPQREGLQDTPARVVRSYAELFAGYKKDPLEVVKTFEDGSCDEMVILKNIEFVSCCEHHMLPFAGSAHIAYIPNGKVIGISKLARLLEIYCRRLQIQERLCVQVTDALNKVLAPKGAACVLEAKHLCMTCRGVNKQHSVMVTSSLTGVFREPGNAARGEFLSMIRTP